MFFKTIEEDGSYLLPPMKGNVTHLERTTVVITSNEDNATVTFGMADAEGGFVPFPNGLTDGSVLNHGKGCRLMANVDGISTNPVVIGYSGE